MTPRTLPMYLREVESLLIMARGLRPQVARRVVVDMEEVAERAWRKKVPPCQVAEAFAKAAKRRYGRDAENPKAGEVFETRRGDRWEVLDAGERTVRMKRAGRRPGPDSHVFGRGNLRRLKQVGGEPRQEEAPRRRKKTASETPEVATDRSRRRRSRWRSRR